MIIMKLIPSSVSLFKVFAAFFVVFATLSPLQIRTTTTNAQTTTVRPYKFGFTIDEQQHRYEKRDERGIVMGEFGFITADGIYHVTVYATDEEGKFRILAMRNYPYESPPKTIDMIVKPKQKVIQPPAAAFVTTKSPAPVTSTIHPAFNRGREACSGCFLPKKVQTTTTKDDIRPLSQVFKGLKAVSPPSPSSPTSPFAPGFKRVQGPNTQNSANPPSSVLSVGGSSKAAATNPNSSSSGGGVYTPNSVKVVGSTVNNIAPVLPSLQNTGKFNAVTKPKTQTPLVVKAISKLAVPSVSANAAGNGKAAGIGVGGNQSKFAATSGTASSSTSTLSDSGDLYRFKYLLDYNGHTETGSRNGNKQGNFYSIGEDNIERTIEYVANEFGFQPKIRWRKLNANEIKTSKENMLKEYEFVWFKEQ